MRIAFFVTDLTPKSSCGVISIQIAHSKAAGLWAISVRATWRGDAGTKEQAGLASPRRWRYFGSVYVPVQVQAVDPSAFPVPVQVPLALIPLNFPVPLVACHLLVADCIWPFLMAAVVW